MLDICGITEKVMPQLFESYQVIGSIMREVAAVLGLPENVKVVAGAGDNAAAAVGTGTVGNSGCNISLGTSGTVFISSDTFGVDSNNGGTPDFTRGTLEGDIAASDVTFYRLQCDANGDLRSYIAQGEVLDVPTRSFGGIGIFAISEMGRFLSQISLIVSV